MVAAVAVVAAVVAVVVPAMAAVAAVIDHPVSWSPLTRALAYQEWACLDSATANDSHTKLQTANNILKSIHPNHPLIKPHNQLKC